MVAVDYLMFFEKLRCCRPVSAFPPSPGQI
jgi:hypothetical protein